jgi:hypothetical protein
VKVWYEIEIKKIRGDDNDMSDPGERYAHFLGDTYEAARWLQDQVKQLKKEPYMAPRFEGEEPLDLEGLK